MTFDVAVVGAGPGGAWAAAGLAARGARVLLLDPSHPREKPCGGGVTGRALALVAAAVPAHTLRSVMIRQARFLDAPRRRDVIVPLEGGRLVVASRTDFDGCLLAGAIAAGATLVPARLATIDRDGGHFRLAAADGSKYRAAFVIGADGANSLVRRRFASAFSRAQLSMATGVFAHGVTSDEIVIEMTANPPGYIWSFPRPDHLAIGICAQADSGVTVATLRSTLRRWIEHAGIADGARLAPYSWPIPSLPAADFLTLEIAGPGWCTIGDAAGLVDPITREGIFFALRSAEISVDVLGGSSSNRALAYSTLVRQEIGADLARAARYKAGFFRPAFSRLMIDALQSSAAIRVVMADLVSGTQGYRGLKRRLAATWQFRLAGRWAVERAYGRA